MNKEKFSSINDRAGYPNPVIVGRSGMPFEYHPPIVLMKQKKHLLSSVVRAVLKLIK